jgi:hypothetical protein
MPFDTEDKNPSLGDPSTQSTTPLSQKQMAGAQQATVNRTQLPAGSKTQQALAAKPGSQDQQTKEGGQVGPDTPFLGGAEALGGALVKGEAASRAQADEVLNLNPAHGQDWWKHALESPVETYFFGKHLYNAFYGALLDPNAIQASVHDIWHQDSAVGWLFRNVAGFYATPTAKMLGTNAEDLTAGAAGMALPMAADPTNIAFAGMPAIRGAKLVAMMLGPTAMTAIFGDRHTPTDLAWGILPAILLGGRLPPEAAMQLEKVAPGATKLLEKFGAVKMAQDANKAGIQDRDQQLRKVLQQGAMGEKKDVLARAWEAGMKPLTKDQEVQLGRSLLDRYGTLDRDRLIPMMIRDGASMRLVQRVWTKLLRMPYPLLHTAPAELALINPTSYLHEMPTEVRDIIDEGHQWTQHMVNQAHLGPAGHAADPNVSRFRSLFGLQTTNKLVADEFENHMRKAAGAQAADPREQDLLLRAIESSGHDAEVAYAALSPQMKYVRDSMREAAAGLGMAAEEVGALESRVHNYWPRVGLLIKEKGGFRGLRRGAQVLTREPNVHRALGVKTVDMLTEDQMQVQQLYKSVKDANEAITRQRVRIAQGILDGTPWHEIEQGLSETANGVIPETDRTLIDGIRAIIASQPEVAKTEAMNYARNLIPEFTTDPFEGIRRLGSQMRAITSQRAVNDLLNSTGKDGKALAVARPTNDRAVDQLRKQGYRAINVAGFHHVLVNDQYGGLLEKASEHSQSRLPAALRALADLEGTAVSMIMYSPRIHGMNMALRLGMAAIMHPSEVAGWFRAGLLQGGGLSQLGLKGVTQIGAEEYRMLPRRYGLVPPNPGKSGFADAYVAKAGELFGDADMLRVPLVRDMAESSAAAKASSDAKRVLGGVKDILWGKQSDLWSWVSDFGVMMWWIELAAAKRGGMLGAKLGDEEAARYATARANSWMGHVSPVDTNPNLHAALKTITFAPNYWRTWGELLTGYYRNQGFGWSKETIKYVVENEIKTAIAAVLFQQLSANALNMALSGHTIYQNDPGNWGKIEVTAPWATELLNGVLKLGLDAKTGRDAKGAKLTWENPLARQVTDTEQLMGLLTSAPNWSPDTFRQGFSSFAAARTSPVMSAIAALGNIDLYRSISSDGIRYVDPNHDTLGGNPLADLITAGGDMTPFSYISQQMQQQVLQGNVGEMKGPFGLPIPKAVLDAFTPGQLGQDAARSFMVGMTGTNPPYMRSSRTQGVSPTDDQYKTVHEIQTKYEQQMNSLSTSTLSGQMAPYQWLATYRQLSMRHAAEMQAIFMHAPEYNNGPLGLTHSWEGLYDQATDKSGILQPDRLRALQHQWRSKHSGADYAAVQNELRVNDHKYPMLSLYHKTLDAYDNWQADWCQANNIDVATMQADLSGYAAVYNDRGASRAWVRDHPEITQFENAKKNEFESGQSKYAEAGLMYALFFNPTAADRYLTTTGETAQQVEQAVTAEQVPAAP